MASPVLETPRRRIDGTVAVFAVTTFVVALLLFLVQPMVGRMVLPAFGGAPQVWSTVMLFFQSALLAGYAVAHLATRRLGPRYQPWLHLGLASLGLVLLPIGLDVAPSGAAAPGPALELLAGLTAGVALPFLLLAASAPTLQRWLSWSDHPRGRDPYFLYATSNLGSAVGLFAYPLLLERYLDVHQQARWWAVAYVMAVALLLLCVVSLRQCSSGPLLLSAHEGGASSTNSIGIRDRVIWAVLAFVPSSLMLGATSTITMDVAAVPVLWLLPLGVYLLSFTIAFSPYGVVIGHRLSRLVPLAVLAALALRTVDIGIVAATMLHVGLVLLGGLVVHGRLAERRPDPRHLTGFYLTVAVGGAAGGVFNALLSPMLFPVLLEYGLIAVAVLAVVGRRQGLLVGSPVLSEARRAIQGAAFSLVPIIFAVGAQGWLFPSDRMRWPLLLASAALLLLPGARSLPVIATALAVALLVPFLPLVGAEHIERTFFGIHRVERTGDQLLLYHGTTLHGSQDLRSGVARRTPTSYYHGSEPFGDVMRLDPWRTRIGVVGLGVGGIAAYGRRDQTLVFHELDPSVVDIATSRFTFLSDTAAEVQIVLGDGRLTIADAGGGYDLLVLDAFTSDAVPVHLLTEDAVASYLDVLVPDGVLVFNISNRYLDLQPVLNASAERFALTAYVGDGLGGLRGAAPSRWVALSRSPDAIAALQEVGWRPLADASVSWTDQRSSLLSVLGPPELEARQPQS